MQNPGHAHDSHWADDIPANTSSTAQHLAGQERRPILLFGLPRSGTTWIGKLFDSHPDTLYRHEPDSFGRLNFMPLVPEPTESGELAPLLAAFIDGLPAVRDTKVSATLPVFEKSYLSALQLGWNRFASHAAKVEAKLRGEALARLRLPNEHARMRVVWKSVESVARLGTIGTALAGARGILILRHPCGYMASVMRGKVQQRFTDGDELGSDFDVLKALTTTEAARDYGVTLKYLQRSPAVVRAAWQWALTNDKALAETADTEQFLPLRYEELCTDPLGTARRLFDWCGLSWHTQTERFLRSSTHTHQDRYYSVFKDPAKAANAWREELPKDVQRQVMEAVGHTRAGRLYGGE